MIMDLNPVLRFSKIPHYVTLGERATDEKLYKENLYQQKIKCETCDPADGFWGTLGWENDTPFIVNGILEFSANGNNNEGKIPGSQSIYKLTEREIEDLKWINPHLNSEDFQVQEKYINFDKVNFQLPAVFNPSELTRLRLTLYLNPNEGALVYYQHSEKENYWDERAMIEYVMYEKEVTADRDRLDYFFQVEPKYILEPVDEENHLYRESRTETGLSFIIKILTFKQKKASEQSIYNEAVRTLNNNIETDEKNNIFYNLIGKEKYALKLFRPLSGNNEVINVSTEDPSLLNGGQFITIENNDQINANARTLLLIHGTFVDTEKSYKDLLLRKGKQHEENSYFQELLATGKFEQIIALDHPTISHDAEQNTKWLLNRLDELNITKFSQPIQIITTSRGALVAEFMASSLKCAEKMTIHKVMMFSAGNGCGYFKTGSNISKVIGIWRNTISGPGAKILLAVAQLSIEWFLKQPGCKLMNEKEDVLGKILSKNPTNPSIRYKCVVSDWDKCLVSEDKWLARVGKTSLDVVIRIALGKQHDWVIGCQQQSRIPIGSGEAEYVHLKSVHGRYLELGYVRNEDCTPVKDAHSIIEDFFD